MAARAWESEVYPCLQVWGVTRHFSTRGECLPIREGSVMVWGGECFTNIERGESYADKERGGPEL